MNKSLKVKIGLNDYQIKKLKRAFKKNEDVNLKFSNKQLQEDTYEIAVNVGQIKKIMSAIKSKNKRGVVLKLSNKQIGGFLPLLLASLPSLATVLGAAGTGAASGAAAWGTKKALDAISGDGLIPIGSQRGRGNKHFFKKKKTNF